VLYFLLGFAVLGLLLLPFTVRFRANTESDRLMVQADWILGSWFIRLYDQNFTAEEIIRRVLSGKKGKTSKALILRSIHKHGNLKKLVVHSSIGTGSAASTAIVCGKMFGLLAPAMITLSHGDSVLDIEPVFHQKQFDAIVEYTLSINAVHTLMALFEILRSKKNGKKFS